MGLMQLLYKPYLQWCLIDTLIFVGVMALVMVAFYSVVRAMGWFA